MEGKRIEWKKKKKTHNNLKENTLLNKEFRVGTKDVFVQIEFDVEFFTPLIKENEQTTKKT